MIAIVDTGGANIASILNAFERLGQKAQLTSDAQAIREAERVILPGVGAAADAMQRMRAAGLVEVVRGLRQPVLGICLGMQLLFERSEEGDTECLGILPGTVARLTPSPGFAVPHMGWNAVTVRERQRLFEGIEDGSYFYFVHSFAAPDGPNVTATSDYRVTVPASVAKANFFGVQFHPERSAAAGARLLENFSKL